MLTKDKAHFVDILHTDAGFLGTAKLRGHVDFFANGGKGKDQPPCVAATASRKTPDKH